MVDVDDGDAAGPVDLHRAQNRAEQLEAPHVVAVVDHAGDLDRVDAGFERLLADFKCARRNTGAMKGSGVGEDRQVDVRGDFRRDRHTEGAHQVEHHFAARRGR